MTKPDAGRVLADDQLVTGPGRQRLVVFQEPSLFPRLDVFGNVMFGLKLCPELSRAERREKAHQFIALVGLEKFERAHVHELSGGMKQRVALARALAPDPQVVLMDEPFGALDAMTREHLYDDVQRIWGASGKTIVFVTHNMREAACLGDRVLLMSQAPGRIVQAFDIPLPRPRSIRGVTSELPPKFPMDPLTLSRGVFQAVFEQLDPGESAKVIDQLPVSLRSLWPEVARRS